MTQAAGCTERHRLLPVLGLAPLRRHPHAAQPLVELRDNALVLGQVRQVDVFKVAECRTRVGRVLALGSP